mgnify:CR=1 FL=1
MTDASIPHKRTSASPYEGGYGILHRSVRVPQLGPADILWIGGMVLVSNIYMIITLFLFYLNMEDYSHAVLVPVIAAAAVWKITKQTEKSQLPKVIGEYRGFLLLGFGLLVQFFAMWYQVGLVAGGVFGAYMTSVGLVLTLWGLFVSFFGFRAVKVYWFPLLYLVFLIPGLPGPPEMWLKNSLRDIVTVWSARSLEMMGFSVFVDRNILEIPGVVLGVADACSGIRSLWAMLAVAPAIAWFLRLRPFLVGLFLPLGVFLAIFQNWMRVVATALLCYWFDMSWAEGTRHDIVGGLSFFLVSMIMVLLSRFLAPPTQGREVVGEYGKYGVYGHYGSASGYGGYGGYGAYHAHNAPEEEEVVHQSAAEQRDFYFSRISKLRVGIFLLLFGLFLGQLMIIQRYAVRSRVQHMIMLNRQPLDNFPGQIGPFQRVHWGELPDQALRILRPSESYVAWYSDNAGRYINVIINFWQPTLGFQGNVWVFPHAPDVCFREAGWRLDSRPEIPERLVDPYEMMYSQLWVNPALGRRQVVLYWYNKDFVTLMMNEQIRDNLAHGTASNYLNRMWHVWNSWRSPKDYSRFQYSVGIYVQEQGSIEETIELAQEFAYHLRGHLGTFGIRPLQRFEAERLEQVLERELILSDLELQE